MKKKNYLIILSCFLAILSIFIMACNGNKNNDKNRLITAEEWKTQYPYQYETYMKDLELDEIVSIPEQYPFLDVIYAGSSYGKYYIEPRGHNLSLTDVGETGRPHPKANCLTCKSSDFTYMVNTEGVEVYSREFNTVYEQLNELIGCYTCHENTGSEVVITHSYLKNALGENIKDFNVNNLSCGQCHCEYYFLKSTDEAKLAYTGLDNMNPEYILNFYIENNVAETTHGLTGTKIPKATHPEFETYLGEGSKHASFLDCADCHMGECTAADGTTYSDHFFTTPLDKPEVLETCKGCHPGDIKEYVRNVQKGVEERTVEVGQKLSDMIIALAAAKDSGKYTDEQLQPIKDLHREAQWYWDFVFGENSNGAHNSTLSYDCLNKAETAINKAMDLISAL